MYNINLDPLFYFENHLIVPPNKWDTFKLNESPIPHPVGLINLFSYVLFKNSNIFYKFYFLIPIPVSLTDILHYFLIEIYFHLILIYPCEVNFNEFDNKFKTIFYILSLSEIIDKGTSFYIK